MLAIPATFSLSPLPNLLTANTTLLVGDDPGASALGERVERDGRRVARLSLRSLLGGRRAMDQALARTLRRLDHLDNLWVYHPPTLVHPIYTLVGSALPHLRDTRGSILFITRDPPLRDDRAGLRTLAQDFTYFGVRVNHLVHVDSHPHDLGPLGRDPGSDRPFRRPGLADLARAALVFSLARGVTGQVLVLDGGAQMFE